MERSPSRIREPWLLPGGGVVLRPLEAEALRGARFARKKAFAEGTRGILFARPGKSRADLKAPGIFRECRPGWEVGKRGNIARLFENR